MRSGNKLGYLRDLEVSERREERSELFRWQEERGVGEEKVGFSFHFIIFWDLLSEIIQA